MAGAGQASWPRAEDPLKVVTGFLSPGSVALAGQAGSRRTLLCAQRGKRAGEQRREEVGAQSQACWLVGGGVGECGCGGQWDGRLENRGTRVERAWGTGRQDWTESENPCRLEQHQSLALVDAGSETSGRGTRALVRTDGHQGTSGRRRRTQLWARPYLGPATHGSTLRENSFSGERDELCSRAGLWAVGAARLRQLLRKSKGCPCRRWFLGGSDVGVCCLLAPPGGKLVLHHGRQAPQPESCQPSNWLPLPSKAASPLGPVLKLDLC